MSISPEFNKYPKIANFDEVIFIAQQAYELGFRGGTGEELYAWLKSRLDLTGLSNTAGLPEEFPAPNSQLSATNKGEWTILSPGTYDKISSGTIEVEEGQIAFAQYDGEDYNLIRVVELGGDFVSSQEFEELKDEEIQPLKEKVEEVIVPSENIADTSKFISGRLNEDGTLHTTLSSLSMDYISVPGDSDITISGFAGAGTQYVRYALLDSENNLITYEMANGHADKEPITIHTPSELGVKLAVTIAVGDSAGQEWLDGNSPYPDTFLINLGDEPIDFVHGGLTINSPAFISKILNLLPDNDLPLIDEGEIWN